jgi:hypothetical protein
MCNLRLGSTKTRYRKQEDFFQKIGIANARDQNVLWLFFQTDFLQSLMEELTSSNVVP